MTCRADPAPVDPARPLRAGVIGRSSPSASCSSRRLVLGRHRHVRDALRSPSCSAAGPRPRRTPGSPGSPVPRRRCSTPCARAGSSRRRGGREPQPGLRPLVLGRPGVVLVSEGPRPAPPRCSPTSASAPPASSARRRSSRSRRATARARCRCASCRPHHGCRAPQARRGQRAAQTPRRADRDSAADPKAGCQGTKIPRACG